MMMCCKTKQSRTCVLRFAVLKQCWKAKDLYLYYDLSLKNDLLTIFSQYIYGLTYTNKTSTITRSYIITIRLPEAQSIQVSDLERDPRCIYEHFKSIFSAEFSSNCSGDQALVHV